MRAIIYNHAQSRIHPSTEAFTTKAGYLLADLAINAGSTGSDLFVINNCHRLSFKQKIMLLESCLKRKEEKAALEKTKEVIKQNDKIKHKTQQQIVASKKIEQSIEAVLKNVMLEVATEFRNKGFSQLNDLAEENLFGFIDINSIEPESAEEPQVCASDMLQMKFNEEEDTAMYFLSQDFFAKEFSEHYTFYSASDAEAEDCSNMYFDACFTIPNINALSTNELKAIRKQLNGIAANYRLKADKWIKLCYDNTNGIERITYFKNELLPACIKLRETINENEVLKHCDKLQNGSWKANVLMGEVPVHYIWQYYQHYGVIQESTREKMDKLKQEGAMQNLRWPVMVAQLSNTVEEDEYVAHEQIVLAPVKKSILVD